ncbi:MAG: hypothetical protein H7Z11_05255 [Verrucomicrobia bacterium]|nr:hypothetical protein [Leptolyngbya sp. ES-bin-22]
MPQFDRAIVVLPALSDRPHSSIAPLSFQPHLPPYDRCFASTMRSFGRFEAFSIRDLSDRTQRTGYCRRHMKVQIGSAHSAVQT